MPDDLTNPEKVPTSRDEARKVLEDAGLDPSDMSVENFTDLITNLLHLADEELGELPDYDGLDFRPGYELLNDARRHYEAEVD